MLQANEPSVSILPQKATEQGGLFTGVLTNYADVRFHLQGQIALGELNVWVQDLGL